MGIQRELPIVGAYYFGNAGVPNFWQSVRTSNLERELQVFREDGFNTVFLVVPWAGLQPSTSPVAYDSQSLELLSRIFDSAEKNGLNVGMRLAFLWESTQSTDRTFTRLGNIFTSDELQAAWCDYFRTISQHVSKRPNLGPCFLSWEDFYWPCYDPAIRPRHESDGFNLQEFFQRVGFQSYLERRMPRGVHVPQLRTLREHSELWGEFLSYWDSAVERLYRLAEKEFSGLGYEFRSDSEHIPKLGGQLFYHYHRREFSRGFAPTTYYNQFTIRQEDLLKNFEEWLDFHDKELGCPVFLSQFNFIDNTYDATDHQALRAQLGVRDMSEQGALKFLREIPTVLARRTAGYAFWAYRDIVNDSLYNSSFERGLEGFESCGECAVDRRQSGEAVVRMSASAQIWQELRSVAVSPVDCDGRVLVDGICHSAAVVRVAYWANEVVIRVEPGPFTIELPNTPQSDQATTYLHCFLVRCEEGEIEVDKLALFSIIFTNVMYDRNLTPRPVVEEVRRLNARVLEISRAQPT
jgi:hypothetical protein